MIQLLLYFKSHHDNIVDSLKRQYQNNAIYFIKSNSENQFVTCDLPVIRYRPFAGNNKSIALMPITPNLCLLIAGSTEVLRPPQMPKYYIFKANRNIVAYLNYRIIEGAEEDYFSAQKEIIKEKGFPIEDIFICKKCLIFVYCYSLKTILRSSFYLCSIYYN